MAGKRLTLFLNMLPWVYIRATTWKLCQEVSNKIRAVAEGAALATGSTVRVERFQNEVLDFVINPVLDELLKEELAQLGKQWVLEKRVALVRRMLVM